ncbi:MAG: hypothetical protein M0Q23_07310 [Syntrophales bacterium]|jgi:hypothetical protein|nr:hypothetical protein [Syntrophales bacterium]MCK9528432.1 hypothetical protein [Syntrophales bacterium]MDX9922455.1 hypothetical protein [Syntrophales bacterium]
MNATTRIKCPNCGTSIDVQDILAHQLEDEIKREYQSKPAGEAKRFKVDWRHGNRGGIGKGKKIANRLDQKRNAIPPEEAKRMDSAKQNFITSVVTGGSA